MEYMLLPLKRYAEFSGRSRRKEYWLFFLLNIIVYVIIGAILVAGGLGGEMLSEGGIDDYDGELGLIGITGGLLAAVWALGTLIPNIALQVRRLHDLGQTGWIYLGVIIAGFIPLVGFLVQIGYLIWMAFPGNAGANQYGEDPKDPTNATVFD